MRTRNILAALLLIVAGLQTTWAQGFRVYKSDGTVLQFSLRTDSIVFYEDMGTDVDFGPYSPVNQMIVGTWYEGKQEVCNFYEDGTTDFAPEATYKFLPYQGTIMFYDKNKMPIGIIKVHDMSPQRMIISSVGDSYFRPWNRTPEKQVVTAITLSDYELTLKPNDVKVLTATIIPDDADNKEVTWESSDETVAEVNKTGRVIANAMGQCTITCSATDGSGVYAECKLIVRLENHGFTNGYEWVNLGLPSGTKWCCCNVGASRPEEYGSYFAWGETNEKSEYNWDTYAYGSSQHDCLRYISLSDIADTPFDVVRTRMGAPWRMPSLAQIRELINNCSHQWTQQNGVNGILVTGPSGGQLFLPAAGFQFNGLKNVGSCGYYWCSSVDDLQEELVLYMIFSSSDWSWGNFGRCDGLSVRGVCQ